MGAMKRRTFLGAAKARCLSCATPGVCNRARRGPFAKMQEKAKIPARKDLNEDFPLRSAVHCADCDSPLTACWTKGRNKHYPYYYCFTKRCESYGKALPRDKIESEFESLLHTLEPPAPLFKTATKMFETRWNYRQAQIAQRGKALEDEIRKLDGKIEQLMDRLVETDGDAMIKAYETRIKKFETDSIAATDTFIRCGT